MPICLRDCHRDCLMPQGLPICRLRSRECAAAIYVSLPETADYSLVGILPDPALKIIHLQPGASRFWSSWCGRGKILDVLHMELQVSAAVA